MAAMPNMAKESDPYTFTVTATFGDAARSSNTAATTLRINYVRDDSVWGSAHVIFMATFGCCDCVCFLCCVLLCVGQVSMRMYNSAYVHV